MKRIIFTLAVLILASPALADVNIWCVNSVSPPNEITVYYDATTEHPNLVRAFALDIVADNDVNILDVCDLSTDYWVHPGSIVIVDGVVTNEGSVVCEPDVGPAGTTGTPDSNWITVEMASLYAATDPCHPTAPPNQGVLLKFYVNGNTCITLSENIVRGGVVMEDPDYSPTVNLTGVCVVDCWYPECWDCPTQCHGDADCDGYVGLLDFYELRDAWDKTYPHPDYLAHPCLDVDRDGYIGLLDFYELRDNWDSSVPADCTPGDINHIYCP